MTAPLTFGQANAINAFQRLPPEYHAERNLIRLCRVPPVRTLAEVREVLRLLVERHEALRTRFDLTENRRQQIVDPAGEPAIDVVRTADEPDRVNAVVKQLQARSFDLGGQPNWSATVLLGERGVPHHVAMCLHHVLVDWHGINRLECDLTSLVGGDRQARQLVLDRPRLRPTDLAWEQRSPRSRERQQRSLEHWCRVLAEAAHNPSPAAQAPGRMDFYLRSEDMWRALQAALRRDQVTLQSVLLALAALAAAGVSGTRTPVLGLTVSNRHDRRWREIVSNLAQGVLLPVPLDPISQSFTDLIHIVHRQVMTCMRHAVFDPDELAAFLSTRGVPTPTCDCQFNHLPARPGVGRELPPADQVVRLDTRYQIGPRLRIWTIAGDDLQITLRSDPSLVPEPTARRILHWFRDEIGRLASRSSPVREMMARLDM
jgi:hypothetical protein